MKDNNQAVKDNGDNTRKSNCILTLLDNEFQHCKFSITFIKTEQHNFENNLLPATLFKSKSKQQKSTAAAKQIRIGESKTINE